MADRKRLQPAAYDAFEAARRAEQAATAEREVGRIYDSYRGPRPDPRARAWRPGDPVERDTKRIAVKPSSPDELDAFFDRSTYASINLLYNVFGGYGIPKLLYGEKEVEKARKRRAETPETISAPSQKGFISEWADTVVNWTVGDQPILTGGGEEIQLGGTLRNLERNFKAIMMGPEYEKKQALQELIMDVGLSLPFFIRPMPKNITGTMPGLSGPTAIKHGRLQREFMDILGKRIGQLHNLGMLPPRLIAKGIDRLLPGDMRVANLMEGVWERIVIPKAEGGSLERAWNKINPLTARWIRGGREGPKNLLEVLQPAVERLEKKGLGKPFRSAQASKMLIGQAGKDLAGKEARMTPYERLDLTRGIRESGMKTSAAKEAVREFRKDIAVEYDVPARYRRQFYKDLDSTLKNATKNLPLNDPVTMAQADELFKLTSQGLEGAKPKVIQEALYKLVGDPTISPELSQLAVELYNLPFSTPDLVAKASRKTTRKMVSRDLIRSGVLRAEGGADLSMVTKETLPSFPELRGSYVPRDVFLELKAWEDISKYSSRWYGKLMGAWKTEKVILRPATHFRNLVSNLILNDWGGLPFYRWDIYREAFNELRRSGPIWKELRNQIGAGGTFTAHELARLEAGMKIGAQGQHASGLDHAFALFDRFARVPKEFYNAEEQWFKLAKYIWNKRQGMDVREAALDAMKWTFNYGEITRFTAMMRSTVSPFFTWQAKVLPLMAETAVKHPVRFTKWIAFYEMLQHQGIQGVGMDDSEWQKVEAILPDYIQNGQFLLLPWRDPQDRLQLLNLTYMIPGMGDMAEMYDNPAGWAFGAPLLNIAGTLLSKRKFSGAPLYYEWEPNSVKWAKGAEYIWKQITPSWVYKGQDNFWTRMYDMFQENPDAYTMEQILAAQVGLKITPIDPIKAARRKRAVQNIHLSEMERDFRKKMRETASPEKRRNIVKKYQTQRKKLLFGK